MGRRWFVVVVVAVVGIVAVVADIVAAVEVVAVAEAAERAVGFVDGYVEAFAVEVVAEVVAAEVVAVAAVVPCIAGTAFVASDTETFVVVATVFEGLVVEAATAFGDEIASLLAIVVGR